MGAGSESFLTVYYLVRRLPAMVTPKWTTVRTQPIAAKDVVAAHLVNLAWHGLSGLEPKPRLLPR